MTLTPRPHGWVSAGLPILGGLAVAVAALATACTDDEVGSQITTITVSTLTVSTSFTTSADATASGTAEVDYVTPSTTSGAVPTTTTALAVPGPPDTTYVEPSTTSAPIPTTTSFIGTPTTTTPTTTTVSPEPDIGTVPTPPADG